MEYPRPDRQQPMPSTTETPSALSSCRFFDSIFPWCCDSYVFRTLSLSFCCRRRRRNLLANSLCILLCHSPYYLCHFTQSLLLRLSGIFAFHTVRLNKKQQKKLFTSVTVTIKQKLQQIYVYGNLAAVAVVSNKRVEMNKTGAEKKREDVNLSFSDFFFLHWRIYFGVRLISVIFINASIVLHKSQRQLRMPFAISTSVRFRLSARFSLFFCANKLLYRRAICSNFIYILGS